MSRWLRLAEILDAHRVFSRFIFILVSTFVIWYTWWTTSWYFDNFEELGKSASTMYGSSGFVGGTISALFKFAIEYAKKYLDGGVNWKDKYTYHKELEDINESK